tara:strand:- start:1065 stop:1925 length:861 start_codon:yes stop_codon:yes gene_type:complete
MYFDEDLVLDLRLNILDKFIKKFVIIESSYNHDGTKKKLNFDINNFKKFKNKINYIVIDKLPNDIESINKNDSKNSTNSKILTNALKRENFQRNSISKGILDAEDEDMIIISDVDEIPNLENVNFSGKFIFFKQSMFYYKFNLKQSNMVWIGSKACKKRYLKSPQWLRNMKDRSYPFWRIDTLFSKTKYMNLQFIEKGGWHFSNIKDAKKIFHKHSKYLHHLEFEESKLTSKEIEELIKDKKILYDLTTDKRKGKFRSSIKLNIANEKELPKYLIENYINYKNWID